VLTTIRILTRCTSTYHDIVGSCGLQTRLPGFSLFDSTIGVVNFETGFDTRTPHLHTIAVTIFIKARRTEFGNGIAVGANFQTGVVSIANLVDVYPIIYDAATVWQIRTQHFLRHAVAVRVCAARADSYGYIAFGAFQRLEPIFGPRPCLVSVKH